MGAMLAKEELQQISCRAPCINIRRSLLRVRRPLANIEVIGKKSL